MNRKDSGFVDTDATTQPNKEPAPVHGSNTASTRRCRRRKTPTESISSVHEMKSQRPESEKQARPSRQRSTTSSSENSTRSKGRGQSSKPSSRRTSCTIVDPTRPARHYRMKSSHTASTATGQDIDDVLALHFRSCSLFTNPSYHSNSGLPSPVVSHGETFAFPSAASRFSSDEMPVVKECVTKHSEDTIAVVEKTNTTMHWTSPSTRKRDYERIDKANSGIRGFMRKIVPRCVSGPQEKFYEKDQSDAGSVRRYRLDDDLDYHIDEKQSLHADIVAENRLRNEAGATRKKWMCFRVG